ncbi:MAG: PQQ-binding-like beta-propeller repeat protein [Vicinamibacterales bacterium]
MTRRIVALFVMCAGAALCWLPAGAQQAGTTPLPSAYTGPPPVSQAIKDFVPVTEAMIRRPSPDNWITWRAGDARWGYSELNQVSDANVGQLRMVWSRAMMEGFSEVEPIVYDGVMFLAHGHDVVQALDATTGDLIWEYRRELPPNVGAITGTVFRHRNIAIYQDKIFMATQDAFLVALDARTGKVLWQQRRGDYNEKLSSTSGPVIADGKVVTGSWCASNSKVVGGCFITANSPQSGEEIWRVNTVAAPGQPGGDTWGQVPIENRKSVSPWIPGSYDPELNLMFWGTGVSQLGRDAANADPKAHLLYTTSTLAIDATTGKLRWYYQHAPRDYRDMDHPFERLIVTTAISPSAADVPWISPKVKAGERRKVVTGIFGKPGLVWSLDAKTGEFLWARETTYQTVTKSIDVNTGRPIPNELLPPPVGQDDPIPSCPYTYGGKNQPSGAYSPVTDAMYMPLNNTCTAISAARVRATVTEGWYSGTLIFPPGMDPARAPVGRLEAISASTGKTLWKYEQRAPIYGSLLATNGNLIFSGDVVRRFRAFNAKTGKVLWETILNGSVGGRPITYRVRGRQYVAVAAGGESQGNALLALTPELTGARGGNTIFVFALPES